MSVVYHSSTKRPTIGVLISGPVFHGRQDRYLGPMLHSIVETAQQSNSNILVGFGVSHETSDPVLHTAWPQSSAYDDFVPIGPWNTDVLIIILNRPINPYLSYINELRSHGHPIIVIGAGSYHQSVMIDNADGIELALRHLAEHGHQRIGFIAGIPADAGDSIERLRAYQCTVRSLGLHTDPNLIVWGNHDRRGGCQAIRQLLAVEPGCTAVLASNDYSARGALEAIQQAGLRVPDDLALIGFDDDLDARATTPTLTTVHQSPSALGRAAVSTALDALAGKQQGVQQIRVPTRLVIRQSCGCPLAEPRVLAVRADNAPTATKNPRLTIMTELVCSEASGFTTTEVHEYC